MSKCTAIELVEGARDGVHADLLKVTFDSLESAYWYFDYSQSLQYVNQDVIVEFRSDIYNGNLEKFIKTFVLPTVVQTLEKKDNFKLYIETEDNNSNLSFKEINIGETRSGAIVFCVASEFKSSANAVWQELIIRDKMMHTAKLRIFDYDNSSAEFAGKYVLTDLSRNKYGFQSDNVAPVNGEMAVNPEISVAEQYVRNYFQDDAVACDYMSKMNLLEKLYEVVDFELGYAIVRMASELAMLDSLYNITKDLNLKAMSEAILCSYGHYARKSKLSDSVNNITLMLSFPFEDRALVAQLLDKALEEKPQEYAVLQNIKETVNTLLEIRKGTLD